MSGFKGANLPLAIAFTTPCGGLDTHAGRFDLLERKDPVEGATVRRAYSDSSQEFLIN